MRRRIVGFPSLSSRVAWEQRHVHMVSTASLSSRTDSDCQLSCSRHEATPVTPPSVTGTASDESVGVKSWGRTKLAVAPGAIFPWRHDETLLPRLMDRTIDGGPMGPGFPSGLSFPTLWMIVTAGCLNVPWYKRFGSAWKQEFADTSGWAFSQAVAGVLSNTYGVPFQDITAPTDGKFDVNFDHTTESSNMTNKGGKFADADLMVEGSLRSLYESAHETGKDQMRILLQTKPIASELQSLFVIPFVSRARVKKSPQLRDNLRKVLVQATEIGPFSNHLLNVFHACKSLDSQLMIDVIRDSEMNEDGVRSAKGTVFAQVLVYCDEVFGVTDLRTGKLVQGDAQLRQVYHLVRLEAALERRIKEGRDVGMHMEPWQITDWDDLLGGNPWF